MMQVVINATDEGTRLRPLSCTKNPFLLPVLQKSILERIVDKAKEHGVRNVVIMVGYMGERLQEYIGKRDDETKITYVKGMYSDGALKVYSDILEDEFFYFSKPVVTNLNLTRMWDYHRRKGAFVTCAAQNGVMKGLVKDKGGAVTLVGEQRLWNRISSGDTGAGIYLMKKDAVRFMPEETSVTLEENILPSLIRSGKSIYTYNEEFQEAVGDIASYIRANLAMLERIPEGIKIEEGAIVETGALLEKPCYIGKNAHIHKGAKVGGGSVIGKDCVVLGGADVKRCIIGEGTRIEKGAMLRGCVTDENVRIGEDAAVYEQAILGSGCVLGNGATVKSFVKIWPEKEIGKGVMVSENIMWGQKKREKMMEKGEIKGVVNVDITSSFATKIGECLGYIAFHGEVGISTDGSPSATMLREGIVSGLMGQGALVKDFGEQPLPITRRAMMFYMLSYGVFINTFEYKGEEWAEICLMEKEGRDISEETAERLEKLYAEGGFMYPEATSIKEREYHFEYKLHYLKQLVQTEPCSKGKMRILLSCPAPWGRRLVMSALSDLKVQVSMYRMHDEDENKMGHFEASVEEGGFDMGFVTDSKCEKLTVVLPLWGEIDECVYEVLCDLIIMLKYKGETVYVPEDASGSVEDLAKRHGANIVRTRSEKRDMMRHLLGSEEHLTEQFVYRYDAIGAIIKMVEFVNKRQITINSLLDKIPKITMAKTKLSMSREEINGALKKIMRIKGAEGKEEGVKITFDKGWVMIIPDRYKETCRVVSEGKSLEAARELCDFGVREIKE